MQLAPLRRHTGGLGGTDGLRFGRIAIIFLLTGVFAGASMLSIMLVAPVAEAGVDQVVDVGEMIQFDGISSQNSASYYWNFRDNGWVNTSPTPTRSYDVEGVYVLWTIATHHPIIVINTGPWRDYHEKN